MLPNYPEGMTQDDLAHVGEIEPEEIREPDPDLLHDLIAEGGDR